MSFILNIFRGIASGCGSSFQAKQMQDPHSLNMRDAIIFVYKESLFIPEIFSKNTEFQKIKASVVAVHHKTEGNVVGYALKMLFCGALPITAIIQDKNLFLFTEDKQIRFTDEAKLYDLLVDVSHAKEVYTNFFVQKRGNIFVDKRGSLSLVAKEKCFQTKTEQTAIIASIFSGSWQTALLVDRQEIEKKYNATLLTHSLPINESSAPFMSFIDQKTGNVFLYTIKIFHTPPSGKANEAIAILFEEENSWNYKILEETNENLSVEGDFKEEFFKLVREDKRIRSSSGGTLELSTEITKIFLGLDFKRIVMSRKEFNPQKFNSELFSIQKPSVIQGVDGEMGSVFFYFTGSFLIYETAGVWQAVKEGEECSIEKFKQEYLSIKEIE